MDAPVEFGPDGRFSLAKVKNCLKEVSKLESSPTFILVVAVALQDDAGRWLMHRRPAGKHHAGLWEFPGGKVESEEFPSLALIREIREELGIALDPASCRATCFADGATSEHGEPIVILLYTCRKWSGIPQALEGGEIGWFTVKEVRTLSKPPLDQSLSANLFDQSFG